LVRQPGEVKRVLPLMCAISGAKKNKARVRVAGPAGCQLSHLALPIRGLFALSYTLDTSPITPLLGLDRTLFSVSKPQTRNIRLSSTEVIPVVDRPIEALRVGLFEYLTRAPDSVIFTTLSSHHGRGQTTHRIKRTLPCGVERCRNTDA
jgi:hypothetical protein